MMLKTLGRGVVGLGKKILWSYTGDMDSVRRLKSIKDSAKELATSPHYSNKYVGTDLTAILTAEQISERKVEYKKSFRVSFCFFVLALCSLFFTPFAEHYVSNFLLALGGVLMFGSRALFSSLRYYQFNMGIMFSYKDYLSHFYGGVSWDDIRSRYVDTGE